MAMLIPTQLQRQKARFKRKFRDNSGHSRVLQRQVNSLFFKKISLKKPTKMTPTLTLTLTLQNQNNTLNLNLTETIVSSTVCYKCIKHTHKLYLKHAMRVI